MLDQDEGSASDATRVAATREPCPLRKLCFVSEEKESKAC